MPAHGLKIALALLAIVALASCRPGGASRAALDGPTFRYVPAKQGGCGNIYLYKGTADDREVLWISADRTKVKLPAQGSRTFDLAAAPDGLQVAIDLWEKAPRFAAYCNDISPDTRKRASWKATRGTLTLTVGGPIDPAEPGPRRYKASARLEGVVFEDDAGNRATLNEETIREAVVGWYAG